MKILYPSKFSQGGIGHKNVAYSRGNKQPYSKVVLINQMKRKKVMDAELHQANAHIRHKSTQKKDSTMSEGDL